MAAGGRRLTWVFGQTSNVVGDDVGTLAEQVDARKLAFHGGGERVVQGVDVVKPEQPSFHRKDLSKKKTPN